MGLFKKKPVVQEEQLENGQLPWGWIARHHEFFLQNWTSTFGDNPNKTYDALKSFVLYMQDVRSLCQSKGECYEEWSKILFTDDYFEKRKQELKELEQK